MKRFNLFFAVLGSLAASTVFAGGWTSGGGNILKDANNPWFLKNTATVTYCILSDPTVFGDIPTLVPDLVSRAIAYWKTQMSDPAAEVVKYLTGNPNSPWEPIRVGTQEFVFHSTCEGTEDVTFQFGVLTPEQKAFLGDPTRLVGVAVRTDYDEVHLRGKGFIYISADSGPLRYKGGHLRDRAWHEGKGGVLYRAIVHEIGHVFGLSHGGAGLMSEGYSESLLVRGLLDILPNTVGDSLEILPFFHFEASRESEQGWFGGFSVDPQWANQLFGPEFHFPIRTYLKPGDGEEKFALFGRAFDNEGKVGAEKKMGSISGKIVGAGMLATFGVKIFLTDGQKIFGGSDWRLPPVVYGPSVREQRFFGKFKPALPGGREFDVIMSLMPDSVVLDGLVDGAYIPGIFRWEALN
ncbi:hypothetical protein WDW37_14430 [Bdellovibrionota bacterium FG-1]